MPIYRRRKTAMVKRKFVKKSYGRKPYKASPYRSLIPRSNYSKSPTPATKFVHLKYISPTFSVNGTGAALGIHVLNANNCFDPDTTGTTGEHQPMGFDQWMLFYENYTVISSKVSATFLPFQVSTATSTLDSQMVGIYTDADTTSTSVFTAMLEQPGTRYRTMIPGQEKAVVLSKTFSSAHFFGKSKLGVLSDPDLRGTDSANSTTNAYYHLFVGNFRSDQESPTIYINAQIDYYVAFTKRRTIAQS